MNVAFITKSTPTEIASCGLQACNTSTEETCYKHFIKYFRNGNNFPFQKIPKKEVVVEFLVRKQSVAMEL